MNKIEKNKKSMETYYWLKEHGICVSCHQEDAEPNRTLCFECGEKRKKRYIEYYKENNEDRKEKIRKNSKIRYWKLKEKGICTCCGKRKISRNSTIYCLDCYIKKRRAYAERNRGKIDRNERPKYGMCYKCGKQELYTDTQCKECYTKQSEVMKTINANPTLRMLLARVKYAQYNSLFFQKSQKVVEY